MCGVVLCVFVESIVVLSGSGRGCVAGGQVDGSLTNYSKLSRAASPNVVRYIGTIESDTVAKNTQAVLINTCM